MKVETKYDRSDKVHVIYKNKALEAEIDKVKVEVSAPYSFFDKHRNLIENDGIRIQYLIIVSHKPIGNGALGYETLYEWFKENQVYGTKEELISKL